MPRELDPRCAAGAAVAAGVPAVATGGAGAGAAGDGLGLPSQYAGGIYLPPLFDNSVKSCVISGSSLED